MFSVTFLSLETGSQVRAEATFESQKKARAFAAKLAETFREVIVWRGQPGGERVETLRPLCDAERFGDACSVCQQAA
jgi:hypothetical protein